MLTNCQGKLPDRLLQRRLRQLTLGGPLAVIDRSTFAATLEKLVLVVDAASVPDEILAPIEAPIRELRVTVNTSIATLLADRLTLPHLERIVFSEGSASKAVALLARMELPALRHLSIVGGSLDARTLSKLAGLPIAAQLESLALENTDLTDDILESFAKKRSAFGALQELDVSFNELGKDGLAAARTIAPTVTSRRQSAPGNNAEKRVRRFAGTRLVVAEEIAAPEKWKRAARDGDVRWATYRGEDEYELFVSEDLQDYGCSCPSSIQPCKHVVALALVAVRTELPERAAGGIADRVHQAHGRREAAEAEAEDE